MVTSNCKACNKAIKSFPSECKKYCSKKCYHNHFRGENRPRWKMTPEQREKIRKSAQGRILSAEHKLHISQGGRGKKRSAQTRKNISKALTGRTLSDEHRKALSRRFISEETKKKMSVILTGKPNYSRRGENSNFWKGGVSKEKVPLRVSIMQLLEYKNWRRAVFDRDNYTCQICGRKGVPLHADHRKPFVIIMLENNIQTINEALNCQELFDINNGRTLCIECDRSTDTYGAKVRNLEIYKKLLKNQV